MIGINTWLAGMLNRCLFIVTYQIGEVMGEMKKLRLLLDEFEIESTDKNKENIKSFFESKGMKKGIADIAAEEFIKADKQMKDEGK